MNFSSKSTLAGTRMGSTFYARSGKRLLDAAGAFAGLVVLLIPFAIVAMAVKLTSDGPVFFKQIRVGQFGKPFLIFKFRTMKHGGAETGPAVTAAGDARITPLGAWLRKTKIDELPQLLNVLGGSMSLVGPRPEVPRYTEKYTDAQKKVLLAKPGITGPSANVYEEQILAGHSDTEGYYLSHVLPAKLEVDLEYSNDVRLMVDLRLIVGTFVNIAGSLRRAPKPLLHKP